MKKTLCLFALIVTTLSFGQFNSSAPWMIELENSFSSEEMHQRNQQAQPFTFNEIQKAFNTYWKTRDHTVKGSGYKPFKRWEYLVENELDENGFVPTALDKWQAWQAKNQFSSNSNSTSRSALADQSDWMPVGPFTTVGTGSWSTGQARVNVVLVDPNNVANGTNILYVGTPAGGIWKSLDLGLSWLPLTDKLPQIGVSGIAVDYNNSNIIYIATGDDDAGDSQSVGVYKSIDGGATWAPTGLNPGNSPTSMNDIYMDPTNSNTLWVATNTGVYKTLDAGVSWSQILTGNIKDIKLKPGDSNIIYAVTANRFYRSVDGGAVWTNTTTGLPSSFATNRMVIDVTPADPTYVYVFHEVSNTTGGIYRSNDSGLTFSTRSSTIPAMSLGQAWYDFAFGVSDTNPEELYTGCLNVHSSIDGGVTFTQLNNWSSPNGAAYTHADIHFLRSYNGTIYAGTDGGVYSSSDSGVNFTNHTFGVQASQLYKIAISQSNPNKMVGGLQDNGGHAFNSGTGQSNNYYGADGMDTAVDPTNDNIFYGFIQYGGGPYISTDAGATLDSSITAPESGNWVTPMAINSVGKLYGGYTELNRLDGATWTALATLGGGLCDYIEIAPSDDTIIYAVVNSVLKRSTNSGTTFTNIETFSSDIKGLGVHQTDPNIVWVTTSGGGKGVFKSINALTASTFTNITTNLPTTGVGEFFNDIVHQGNHTDNPIFLATGLGVYRLDDTSTNWEPFFANLPNTNVRDLEISLGDESLTAATYGRGVWKSSIPIQMTPNDIKLLSINNPVNTGVINCNTNVLPDITVKNNGLNTINTIDVNYTVDGGALQTYNWIGTLASTLSTTITLPLLSLSRGQHVLSVEAIIASDSNVTNNSSDVIFSTNDIGVVNDINTFENTTDALIADALWEKGVPTDALLNSASSGTQVYGTDLDANHPDGVKAHLVSQCYDLSQISNPVLEFQMAYDLEPNFDIVYVEYSTNQGNNWTVLGSINSLPNWYTSDRTNASSGAANDCQNCPGSQWTGTDATMALYEYNFINNAGLGETDLTAEANILFRIVFHADGGANQEGVIIDDFVITGTPLAIGDYDTSNFLIYPNPSTGIFNIKLPNNETDLNVNVIDVSGKRVFETSIITTENNYRLDLNNLSTGIYFLSLQGKNHKTTKKIIIK